MAHLRTDKVGRRGDLDFIKKLFTAADSDGDGVLCMDEFSALLSLLDAKTWTTGPVNQLFKAADADCSGALDMKELIDWILEADKDPTHDSSDDDAHSSSSSSASSL